MKNDVGVHLVGVRSSGTGGKVFDLLQALLLESLGLDTTSLSLVSDLLLHDLLGLLLVDVLDQDTLILEHVTLALHVKDVVQVLVDLLRVAVLLQQATEHAQAAHPDDSLGHPGVLVALTLTSTTVAPLALSSQLLDHKAILSKLANIETGVRHRDLVDLIWVQPNLPLTTLEHGRGEPLLELEGHHCFATPPC